MSQQIDGSSIGAFVLQVQDAGSFVVVNFQLNKAVGKIPSCTVVVADYTQQVVVNEQKGFPKKLGSIKSLFQQTTKIQNTGRLYSCKLLEYKSTGETNTWFSGKLCVITPVLNTAYGIKAGLQCYCMGKACQLLFQPFSDFIYVPGSFAGNQQFLQRVGVFSPHGITQALFAGSMRPSVQQIISRGEITNTSSVLYILNAALNVLMEWNKISPQLKELGGIKPINLGQYFAGGIKLSKTLLAGTGTVHPYIQAMVENFANGFEHDTILDAVINTLGSGDRYITFIPSPMTSGQDLLLLVPAYIRKCDAIIKDTAILDLQNMIGCAISANTLEHIKTPTYVYVRGKKKSAWKSRKDNITDYDKTVGSYCLKGAASPYRLQIMDVPAWMLNTIIQSQQNTTGNKKSQLKSKSVKEDKQKKEAVDTTKSKQMMDAFAKTIFFNRYMLNKQANISLAVNAFTLGIDMFLGDSLTFKVPIQAADLGGNDSAETFYGVMRSVTYSFQAASTPTAKSTLGINCYLTGIMRKGDQGAQDLYNGTEQNFIYEKTDPYEK